MELDNLPVTDWELALKLAGNQKELANDIHDMLLRNLHSDLIAIKQLYQAQNYSDLQLRVHKLHGALCYCGLPRLKAVVADIETELKHKAMNDFSSLITQLDTEATLLLERYSSILLKN